MAIFAGGLVMPNGLPLTVEGLLGAVSDVALACGVICLSHGITRFAAVALVVFLKCVPPETTPIALAFGFILLACRSECPRHHLGRLMPTTAVRLTLALTAIALAASMLAQRPLAFAAAGTVALVAALLASRRRRPLMLAVFFAGAFFVFRIFASYGSAAPAGIHPDVSFVACAAFIGLIYTRFLRSGGIVGTVLFGGTAVLLMFTFAAAPLVEPNRPELVRAAMLTALAWMLALGTPRPAAWIGLAIAALDLTIVVSRPAAPDPARGADGAASDTTIWARFEVTPTPLARLISSVYDPPAETFAYRFGAGPEQCLRDFSAPPSGPPYLAGRRPATLVIWGAGGTLWSSAFPVALRALPIPAPPATAGSGGDAASNRTAASGSGAVNDCSVNVVDAVSTERPSAGSDRALRVIAWVSAERNAAGPDVVTLVFEGRHGENATVVARAMPLADAGVQQNDVSALREVTFGTVANLHSLTATTLRRLQFSGGAGPFTCTAHVPVAVADW